MLPEDAFWAKVEKTETCWLWTGSLCKTGYGKVKATVFGLTTYLAHRVSYTMIKGLPRSDMVLDHLCRVRRCVNPDHLEEVSNAENLRRSKRYVTHCPSGHPYDEINTYLKKGKNGKGVARSCRTCHRERERERTRRQRMVT